MTTLNDAYIKVFLHIHVHDHVLQSEPGSALLTNSLAGSDIKTDLSEVETSESTEGGASGNADDHVSTQSRRTRQTGNNLNRVSPKKASSYPTVDMDLSTPTVSYQPVSKISDNTN